MSQWPEHYQDEIADGNEARMGGYCGGCVLLAAIIGTPIVGIVWHLSLVERGLTEMQVLETAWRVISGQ